MIDIALQVVEGELVGAKNDLGDAVNKNDKKFGKRLPVRRPADGRLARPARQGRRTKDVRATSSAVRVGRRLGVRHRHHADRPSAAAGAGVLLIGRA